MASLLPTPLKKRSAGASASPRSRRTHHEDSPGETSSSSASSLEILDGASKRPNRSSEPGPNDVSSTTGAPPGPVGLDASKAAAASKPKRFQQMSKAYLLTFPQSGDQVPNEMWARVKGKWGPKAEYAVIARELHTAGSAVPGEPGQIHYHMVLVFKSSVKMGKCSWGDFIISPEKHGNYLTLPKSLDIANAIKYLKKDGEWTMHGDLTLSILEDFLAANDKAGAEGAAKKTMIWSKFVHACEDGMTFEQALEHPDYKSFCAQNTRKIKDWLSAKQMIPKKLDPVLKFRHLSSSIPQEKWSVDFQKFMWWWNAGDNIFATRPIREKQLMVLSPFGAGKTTLINRLSETLRVYYMPLEDWHDGWRNNAFDLCVFDEFHGQKPIGWFNQWLDGCSLPLKVKGQSGYLKEDNVPTVIFGNFGVDQCYSEALSKNAGITGPLKDRLLVCELSTEEIRSLGVHTEGSRVVNDETNYGCLDCAGGFPPRCRFPTLSAIAAGHLENFGSPKKLIRQDATYGVVTGLSSSSTAQ